MNHLRKFKKFVLMLTLVILLPLVVPVVVQANWVAPDVKLNAASVQGLGPSDPVELGAFLDDLLAKQMAENHIAGAAVSVVKDGKVLLAKGYGYADVDKQIPVDPEQTMFRIGSVGKTLTWTAVMQLVEQGKLNLDADVNTYLDFRIPDTYPQPITLRHLMAHTSGFEDRLLGSVVSDANDLAPERDWLISHMSARVRPPGDCAGYANYNALLAGYFVARVSGKPYDQYIQEHILDPLGMTHSTVRSPLPSDLRARESVGYTYADGVFRAFPDYIGQPAGWPSGGHRASVADMARFMIAHLQGGRYSDASIAEARILKESTARQMQSILYSADPRLMGLTYGFADLSDNGQRTLGHQGYAPPMHSLLLLLPDQNLGVFVVYNSAGGGGLTTAHAGFQKAFFDHYYPAPAVAPRQPPADFAQRAGRFLGVYRYASSPHTTLIKIVELFGAYRAEVSNPGDGTLLLSMSGFKWRFVEVEPLHFRQVDGSLAMVFREDGRGRIIRMYTDFMPWYGTVKLDWYETSGFNMALALGCVLIFLSVIPTAAIRLIRDRRRSSERKPVSRGANVAQWIILGISIANLLVIVAVAWGAMGGLANELADFPLLMKILVGFGVLAALLTVGALVYTVLAWKERYWGIAGRLYYTLVTIAAVAFVWFLNYWNLLGWRF